MAQYQLRRRVLPSAFEIRQEFEARDANAAIVIAQERATIPAVELWEDGMALCKLVLEPVGQEAIWTIKRPDGGDD